LGFSLLIGISLHEFFYAFQDGIAAQKTFHRN
jgi:hypothetical protein